MALEILRPVDLYWHTLVDLVLVPTWARSSTYLALPRPERDQQNLAGLGQEGLRYYSMLLADLRTPQPLEPQNRAQSPTTWIYSLIRNARRHVQNAMGRDPQARWARNAILARRSPRIEGLRGPWWTETVRHWKAHIHLMQETLDAINHHGFPSAIEQLARNEPIAFWGTYWNLLILLNDGREYTDRERRLFADSDQQLLVGLLCHELPRRLYPLQERECIAALNHILNRLRMQKEEYYLENDYVRQALGAMQIDIMPMRSALGNDSLQTFHDLPRH
jgi:hypothetical protein